MKFFSITVLATIFFPISVIAEETTNISQTDLQQLQQMACSTGINIGSSSSEASLEDIEATFAAMGMEVTDEQLDSAYAQALLLQAQLQESNSLGELCSQ